MFDFLKLGGGGKKKEEQATAPKPAITIGPAPTGAGVQAPAALPTGGGGQLLTSEGREVTAVVEDLQKEVERLKDSLNVVKESVKGVNNKLEEIEKTLGQLASIYEIVMNQLNPFLDEDEKVLPMKKPKVSREPAETTTLVQKPAQSTTPPQPAVEKPSQDVVLPYVDLTNPKVIETLIDWAKFLVEKVGHAGIEELLQYYVDIRWISEDVKEIVKRYADGIRVDIEPDVAVVQLDPEDHAKSLEYILSIKDIMSR